MFAPALASDEHSLVTQPPSLPRPELVLVPPESAKDDSRQTDEENLQAVPEPSSLILSAGGLIVLAWYLRRRGQR
jgi:hypothetical protein